MAGNNSIQILRGTSAQRANHTETSLAGQPIFETDTNKLYIGDGATSINNLESIHSPLINVSIQSDGRALATRDILSNSESAPAYNTTQGSLALVTSSERDELPIGSLIILGAYEGGDYYRTPISSIAEGETVYVPSGAVVKTSEEWNEQNPVLLPGQFGYETDTNYLYVGDGTTSVSNLSPIQAPQSISTRTNWTTVNYNTPATNRVANTTTCMLNNASVACVPSGTTTRVINNAIYTLYQSGRMYYARVNINYSSRYQIDKYSVATVVNTYYYANEQWVHYESNAISYPAGTLPDSDQITCETQTPGLANIRVTIMSVAKEKIEGVSASICGAYTIQEIGKDENRNDVANIDINAVMTVGGCTRNHFYIFKGDSLESALNVTTLEFDQQNTRFNSSLLESGMYTVSKDSDGISINYEINPEQVELTDLVGVDTPIGITIYGARITK